MLEEIILGKQLRPINEIVYLLNKYSPETICIAGSYPMQLLANKINIIEGKPLARMSGDIDIFFAKHDDVAIVQDYLFSQGYREKYITERAITVIMAGTTIQLIYPYDEFDYPRISQDFEQHVIDYFDFTCCQAILTKELTIKASPDTINAIIEKKIEPAEVGNITPMRIRKYIKKGFSLTSGILFCLSVALADEDYFSNIKKLY